MKTTLLLLVLVLIEKRNLMDQAVIKKEVRRLKEIIDKNLDYIIFR